jgi:hypothetical protein
LTPILIPQGQTVTTLGQILRDTKADVIFASAGVISENDLAKAKADLKYVVWVVEHASRKMEWLEEPKTGSKVAEWHSIIDQYKSSAIKDLSTDTDNSNAPNVLSIWQTQDTSKYEIIEYTQAVSFPTSSMRNSLLTKQNIISSVAAQAAALPRGHRLEEKDLIISLESLTNLYPLSITLAGLHAHASIATTSIAGPKADYELAFQRIKPTIVIASAETIATYLTRKTQENNSLLSKIHKSRAATALAAGTMRSANTLVNGQTPRLIYTSERAGVSSAPLSALNLADLRIFTGARVVYALTVPLVAGAVVQTHMLDYRTGNAETATRSHFGAPLSSVEVKVVETDGRRIADDNYDRPTGRLVVAGPAVVGRRELDTGLLASFGDDNTLSLL